MSSNQIRNRYGSTSKQIVTGILIGLMVATAVFTIQSFIGIKTEQVITTDDSSDIKTTLYFDAEKWKQFDQSSLLMGILTASAAIAAIAFTITQMLISHISEKYSPYVLDVYVKRTNSNVPFLILIFVITSSTILLLISDLIMDSFSLMLILATVEFFIYSLISFVKNFFNVFRAINPLEFMNDMAQIVVENMTGAEENE